ncbi:MAG: translation elongation factor Ts [Pelagibacteraceae bacterium TMED237]|nr:MAG: translation elongation factor Ts [Pelagibacteraceae bacterium TMED237]|tara:strand:+ start:3827 stop:4687 length:861 start_codon:yes stop_codon:yes gene_type:complete
MSDLTSLIKELRNKSGAGFLDCKTALSENNNDIEKAIEYLRKKGLSKASKKTSREANEGAIGIYSNDKIITIVKVNSETDFAAKSDTFLNFLDQLGSVALNESNANLNKEEFLKLKFNNSTVSEFFSNMIAKIGENLILKDLIIIENNSSSEFMFYIHNSYKDNIGKIASLIKYETKENDENIKTLSKNICMHIAAMKPESMDIDDLDKSIIEKEKNIQRELILNSGKPSNIVDKILEGKMKKFYSEITLLNQAYILDQDKTIKSILEEYKNEYSYKLLSFNLISL